jgi:carboxymethylenebutenolidase
MSQPQPDGYLATPAAGSGPPVLVLHAWWGLNDTIKGLCDRLADEGYLAFAPDLYHGEVADTIEGAEKLSSTLDSERAQADIKAAIEFMHERSADSDGKLALVGFSLGAYFAWGFSNSHPDDIDKVIVFYGAGEIDFGDSQAAYLGHFAENDPYEDADYIAEMEAALKAAGRPVTFHTYAGTGHWFFEPDREDAYDAAAAQLAWERTLEFLRN